MYYLKKFLLKFLSGVIILMGMFSTDTVPETYCYTDVITVQKEDSDVDTETKEENNTDHADNKEENENIQEEKNGEEITEDIENDTEVEIPSPEEVGDTANVVSDSNNGVPSEENTAVQEPNRWTHTVYNNCSRTCSNTMDPVLMNTFLNGETCVSMDETTFSFALGSLEYFYCNDYNTNMWVYYAWNGYCEIAHPEYVVQAIYNAQAQWQGYFNYVINACYSIDLYGTDEEIVNRACAYVINNFSYQIIDTEYQPYFVQNGVGQCINYAILLQDMLKCLGYNAWVIQSGDHAWTQATINGITYNFDATSADTSGDWNTYLWY